MDNAWLIDLLGLSWAWINRCINCDNLVGNSYKHFQQVAGCWICKWNPKGVHLQGPRRPICLEPIWWEGSSHGWGFQFNEARCPPMTMPEHMLICKAGWTRYMETNKSSSPRKFPQCWPQTSQTFCFIPWYHIYLALTRSGGLIRSSWAYGFAIYQI